MISLAQFYTFNWVSPVGIPKTLGIWVRGWGYPKLANTQITVTPVRIPKKQFSSKTPGTGAALRVNNNRQTCSRDGKTLKVFLSTEFCPLCDKQVIASALRQLRINFISLYFQSFPNCHPGFTTRASL